MFKKLNLKFKKLFSWEFYEDLVIVILKFFIDRNPISPCYAFYKTLLTAKGRRSFKKYFKKHQRYFSAHHPFIGAAGSFIFLALILSTVFSLVLKGEIRETKAAWWDGDWKYRKTLEIDHTKVAADLTNFPVLVSITDSSLIANAQADGDDIVFATHADNQKLAHEIESYNSATGTLVAWVKVPNLSSSVNTQLDMYYGNQAVFSQEDSVNVWDSNYKMVQHLNEDPTGGATPDGLAELLDSTSYSNNGNSGGSMTTADLVTGKMGGALDFDGSDDLINCGKNSSINNTGPLTWEAWIYPRSRGEGDNDLPAGRIINKLKRFFLEDINGSGRHMGFTAVTSPLTYRLSDDYINYNTAWQHVLVTWDGTADYNGINLYIDGVLRNSGGAGTGTIEDDSAYDLVIGNLADQTRTFDGYIDEARVSDVVRSAGWIETQYNNQADPSGFFTVGQQEESSEQLGEVVGYWPMDKGYGSTAYDESGDGNHGTVSGATWQGKDSCVIGKCLAFDGSNDSVGVASTITGVKTVNFWVKTTSTTAPFINLNASAYLDVTAGTVAASGFTTPTVYVNAQESTSFVANRWQMITVTSSATIEASAIEIGKIASAYLEGTIDEVKFYPYTRSPEQIRQDYNAGIAGTKTKSGAGISFGGEAQQWQTDGLVGHWQLDETGWGGTAGEVIDLSGNNHHGTAVGGVTTATAKFGRGGNFDGADDYLDIPEDSSLDVSQVTLSAWVKTNNEGEYIIAKDPPPTSRPENPQKINKLVETKKVDSKHYEIEYNHQTKVKIKEDGESLPEISLEKWGGESSIKLKLREEQKKRPGFFRRIFTGGKQDKLQKRELGEKLSYSKDKLELKVYPTSKQELAADLGELAQTATVKKLEKLDLKEIRYIKQEKINVPEMTGGYMLFDHITTDKPVLRSYIPPKGFVFFGYRNIDKELENLEQAKELPVIRFKVDGLKECPVILSDGEALVLDFYFPNIKERADEFFKYFDKALAISLKKYGLDKKVKRKGDLIYYLDGIQVKQLGRIAVDAHHLITFLYLDTPKHENINKFYRPLAHIRDKYLAALSGLRALDPTINASLKEELVNNFSSAMDSKLVEEKWTKEEQHKIVELSAELASEQWLKGDKDYIIKQKTKELYSKADAERNLFEFELVLKEKPKSNKVVLDIETEGLEFYYQDKLSEEERREGVYRPENVEGSYAVYHKDKKNGKYGTGKAFHIYRPQLIDSAGRTVWGQLHYNKETDTLTNTISQEFLDSARYPIRHATGLTFGFTGIGASGLNDNHGWSEGHRYGSLFTGDRGEVTHLNGYFFAGNNVDFRIYRHHSDHTMTLLENASVECAVGEASWTACSYPIYPQIKAEDYVLAVTYDKSFNLAFDTGVANQGHQSSNEALFVGGSATHNARKYSLYATYIQPPKTDVPYALSTVNGGQFLIKKDDIAYTVDVNDSVADGIWHQLVGTYNGKEMKLYLDGVLQGINTSLSGNLPVVEGNLRIGADYEIVPGQFFNGQIDEVKVYNQALSAQEIKALYSWAPGPVLHLKLDEKSGATAYDNSNFANNGTLTNGTGWARGKYGGALVFDGDNDYLNLGDPDSLKITGDMTISAWIKADRLGGEGSEALGKIFNKGGFAPNRGYSLGIRDNGLFVGNIASDASTTIGRYCATPVSVGEWHHVAFVYNSGSLALDIYLDGMLDNGTLTGTVTGSQYSDNGIPVWLGGRGDLSTQNFAGVVDEVKVYNYVRSQKQILEDMHAGKPALNFPVLQLAFDKGYGMAVYDKSVYKHNGTVNFGVGGTNTSATAMWDKGGKIGGAMEFDGTDDYLEGDVQLIADYPFTISSWIKTAATGSTEPSVIARILDKDTHDIAYGIQLSPTNYQAQIRARNITVYETTGAASLNDGTWHHIAGVWASATDRRLYVDGIRDITSENNTATTYSGAVDRWDIGRAGDSTPDSYFNGLIDETKIWNYALSNKEIKQEYATAGRAVKMGGEGRAANNNGTDATGASAKYCVPGDSAKCDGPVLELTFNEKTGTTAYDSSGNGNNGTLVNSPSWARGKYGGALQFAAGTNDYLETPKASSLDFSQAAGITLGAWVYLESQNDDNDIMSGWDGDVNLSDSAYWRIDNAGSQRYEIRNMIDASPTDRSVATTWDINRWYFLSYTYDGANEVLYRDGKIMGSWSQSGDIDYEDEVGIMLGTARGRSEHFGGRLDEVKIYNYARTPTQIAWDYNRGRPVAHWKFNEGEGLTLHDESENGLDGTLNNMDAASDWVTGKTGQALDFDGSNDYISMAYHDIFDMKGFHTNFSLSAWIKTDSLTSDGDIIGRWDYLSALERQYVLKFEADNNSIRFAVHDGDYQIAESIVNSIVTNKWTHVVGVADNGTLEIYIDGAFSGTTDSYGTVTDWGSELGLEIGVGNKTSNPGLENFDGQLDEVKIYNYPLTAEQIKNDYAGAAMRFE